MNISIKTKVPGPKSIELAKKRSKNIANGHASVSEIFIEKAVGANLIDVDGNIFIDYAGGIGTMNVGHCHPKVIYAITEQVKKFIHPCFTVAPYDIYVELAERLSNVVPISGDCKTAFFNSGAEAVENSIKISKSYTNRNGILVFSHAFHGRTQMTMSMTYKEDPYKKGFGPFVDNIYRIEFPTEKLDLTKLDFDPETIACVVIEPIAGEGGFIPVDFDAMIELRRFCDKNGIILIADEVQTGFGRTGTLFAMEQYKIEPDLMTLAKSIAGGLPLSGVIGKKEIMDSVHPGGIGGTFGGNPVACAAALAVLDIMEEEKLPERAISIGNKVKVMVQSIQKSSPWVKKIRGVGAMQGIVICNPDTGLPDKDHTLRIYKYAMNNGLIMITAGTDGNVIRTLMPLTISTDELEESLYILSKALKVP